MRQLNPWEHITWLSDKYHQRMGSNKNLKEHFPNNVLKSNHYSL